MATTEKEKTRPMRGQETIMLKLDDLAITEGFNCRVDYGDIPELAKSIKANGVKVPLRGHKDKDGKYYITDGHRRLKALQHLFDTEGIDMFIPLISDSRDTEEQRIINLIICNQGKKLNPVEEADVVNRLINYGYTQSEIQEKLGFTKIYVKNLVLLNSAPKKLKNMITGNIVSATLTIQILREEKDFETAMQVIEDAISNKSSNLNENKPSTGKITKKDIQSSQGKHNSFQCLKKAIRIAEKNEMVVIKEKKEIHEFATKIISGEYDIETLMGELYVEKYTQLEIEG